MNLYTEQQMRDAIKMARNGARSEDNIIDSLNFIKQHSEVTMNDKIKDLLSTAYKTDSIAKNKWRIENLEQLREQRETELKELMEKDVKMDSGSVQWFFDQLVANRIIVINGSTYWDKVKAKHEMLLEQAKEIEVAGREMSYDEGYKEGYKRALELIEWGIQQAKTK